MNLGSPPFPKPGKGGAASFGTGLSVGQPALETGVSKFGNIPSADSDYHVLVVQ